MRSDSAAIRCCFLAAVALSAILARVAPAAELTLTPILDSSVDLVRVVPLAEGGVAVLDGAGIDVVRPGGTSAPAVRAREDQTLVLGEGGRFFGVVSHREGAADFAPTESFELHTMDGSLVWSMGATDDVTYAISPEGAVVGLSLNINTAERNALHFYAAGGVVNAAETVPYLTGGRFDATGRVFVAQGAAGGIRAYDPIGTPLWGDPSARLFAMAPGGEMVAVSDAGSLRLIRSGATIAAIAIDPGFLVRRIAIAPDGGRVAIAGKHEIRVYDGALAPLFAIRTGDDALSWTAVDVASADGWILACLARDIGPTVPAERRHPDGEVRAYDASGTLAHRAPMQFGAWNIFTPTGIIDPSGRAATITTRRSIYRTVLP